jgi:hypothetical protein
MKADFSRDSFDPTEQYLRVLMQQGRVLLDADWNEQVSILLHRMQTMAEDLIGPHGGPQHRCGFEVTLSRSGNNLDIGTGNYYVDGMLCQNGTKVSFTEQPYLEPKELRDGRYLIYLKAWERHVTAVEDSNIREVALGGVDTTTRSQVVWQVRALSLDEQEEEEESGWLEELLEDIFGAQEPTRPVERAYQLLRKRRIDRQTERAMMTVLLLDTGYRGAENQLYRVEIHDGGTIGRSTPTMKWARDNASVVFPIVSLRGNTAEVEHLGEDSGSPLTEGDWVEIAGRETASRDDLLPLMQVESIDRVEMIVTLAVPDGTDLPVYDENSDERAFLRRWHSQGVVPIEEPDQEVRLEEGLRVKFGPGRYYFTGDYWMIPVRAGVRDGVEGEQERERWKPTLPHGISRHYAPLAVVSFVPGHRSVVDCRRWFRPLDPAAPAPTPDRSREPAAPRRTAGRARRDRAPRHPRKVLGLIIGGVFHPVDDILTIGRAEDNDISLPLEDVSRHHAQVERSEEGTLVLKVYEEVANENSEKDDEIVPRGQSVEVEPGSKIRVAGEEIAVVEQEVPSEER